MFLFDNRIPTVRPYLLLGAAQHEKDYALLRESGVTHIIQVGSELRPSFPDRFKYLRISIDDAEQEDLIKHLPRCFKFINDARRRGNDGGGVHYDAYYDGDDAAEDPAGGLLSTIGAEHNQAPRTNGNGTSAPTCVVLVHCLAGMSRSATVVLTYLMWDEKLAYTEALKQVKAARPCMYPNLGFLLQVWEWEAAGCDLDAWNGWSKVRFAERLAEYRRAQSAAGLHRSVRVWLPMSPCASPGPVAGGGTCDPRLATANGGASTNDPDTPSVADTASPADADAAAAALVTPHNVSSLLPGNRPIGPLAAVITAAVTPIETAIGNAHVATVGSAATNPAVAAGGIVDIMSQKTMTARTAAATPLATSTGTSREPENIVHVWRRLWQ